MVLSVCRHVLDDEHDVEDAFQATFLILVKKARSIRDRDVLGMWLYGVARRVAVRAQVDARRRHSRERTNVEEIDVPDHRNDSVESHEIRAIVDSELDRLPRRYRAAVILCDLEGQTHEQAAAELGCPVGTVKSRLSRGRDRLRGRLARRGITSPSLAVGAMLPIASGDVPNRLLTHTVRTATQLVSNQSIAAGTITAHAVSLTDQVIHTMAMTKLKIATVVCLALGTTGVTASSAAGIIRAWQAQGAGRNSGPLDRRVPATPGSEKSPASTGEAVTQQVPKAQQKPEEPPERGALHIARLKHRGADWNIAPTATAKVMETLREPPLRLDVVLDARPLSARDPQLVFYPFLYLHGREKFSV